MFPYFPVACLAGMIASALGLTWYDSMSKEKQEEADQLAANIAWQLYSKSVSNLTKYEMEIVASAVHRRMHG